MIGIDKKEFIDWIISQIDQIEDYNNIVNPLVSVKIPIIILDHTYGQDSYSRLLKYFNNIRLLEHSNKILKSIELLARMEEDEMNPETFKLLFSYFDLVVSLSQKGITKEKEKRLLVLYQRLLLDKNLYETVVSNIELSTEIVAYLTYIEYHNTDFIKLNEIIKLLCNQRENCELKDINF